MQSCSRSENIETLQTIQSYHSAKPTYGVILDSALWTLSLIRSVTQVDHDDVTGLRLGPLL